VLNLKRKEYAIIATDTRVTYLDGRCSDKEDKLYQSKVGWVSGTGVGDVIRDFHKNHENANEPVSNTFLKAIRKYENKYPSDILYKTLVSYSYLGSSTEPEGWCKKNEKDIFRA
jgi:hypothetical protein